MKKIILILIDSLMPEHFENAITSGKVPALKFLSDNGVYKQNCVTAFPTMTASVDASLLTGTYPDKHRIPGLIWYKADEKRLIDYINGTKTVLKLGINSTAGDVLINLNEKHLSKNVTTIFEELSANGLSSGAINFIIHRGRKKYQLKLPLLLNLVTKFSYNNITISGPDQFYLGVMQKQNYFGRKFPYSFNQTIFKKFGINDSFAIQAAKYMITSGNQPDFLAVYLPDHDHYLHKYINQPLKSLEKVDKQIKDLLNTYGTWKQALEQNTFIIVGDHGQTKIGNCQKFNIDLDNYLKDFNLVRVGKNVTSDSDVIIANNERMAYIYLLKKGISEAIKSILLKDSRIDFIAWKKGRKVIVKKHNGKSLNFVKGESCKDDYGMQWEVDGDFDVLDLTLEEGLIRYNNYPDGLARLYGALFSQEEEMILVTAKPGYEFYSESFPTHLGGGSHGSLHYIDSIVPLIVAGASIIPDSNLRLVDIKDYILQLFNVRSATTG